MYPLKVPASPSLNSPSHALSQPAQSFRRQIWRPHRLLSRWKGLWLAMFACGLLCTQTAAAWAAPPRTIEVVAEALLEVNPDVVDLRLQLQTEATMPKQAVTALQKKRKALRKALLEAGLKSEDLSMSHTSIYPKYKQGEIIGYQASLNLLACIKDIPRLAHFIEAAAQAGVNSLSTSFRSLKVPQNKKKLRAMALRAAKEKAQHIAKVMQVQVGKVYFVKNIGQRFRGSWSNTFAYRRSSSTTGGIQPGAIQMTLQLRVAFFIKDQAPAETR